MHVLTTELSELDLSLTLRAGQVFGWDFVEETQEWIGTVGSQLFALKQCSDGGSITYTFSGDGDEVNAKETLRNFFQLDVTFPELLTEWSEKDKFFGNVIGVDSKFRGLRICRQDPFECLISFIVSANNNIKRISQNLKSIRRNYGDLIGPESGMHAFPTVAQLGKATSDQLRNLGLGYRAQYIVKTVERLQDPSVVSQLYSLREETNVESARSFLLQFQGVGRKVADCVCLYSLDFPQIAPVDTHMFQIAQRLFSKSIKKDNRMHDVIQELMIERFGGKAGWAHCFLFAADLRDLQDTKTSEKKARFRE